MMFNMGSVSFAGFTEFKKALHKKDYQKAAVEMIDSEWYHQVPNRAKRLVEIMQKQI